MHWLPLVAMVIASALPFPHSPSSRIAAATTEPGANPDRSKEDHYDSPGRMAAPKQLPVDYNTSHKDYNMAATPGRDTTIQTHLTTGKEGSIQPGVNAALSSNEGESRKGSYRTDCDSADSGNVVGLDGTKEEGLKTSKCNSHNDNVSDHDPVPQDYNPNSSGGKDGTHFGDLAKMETLRSPLESQPEGIKSIPLQASTVDANNIVPHGVYTQGHRGPEPSVQPKDAMGTESIPADRKQGKKEAEGGLAPTKEPLAMEVGLGVGLGPGIDADTLQEGEELFLDAHPRVLFSPSPSPPKHPPLLFMLETGVLPEEEQEEQEEEEEEVQEEEDREDGHIEGHGDRASNRNTLPGWRPAKRSKRSHPSDVRRGERSVCESESVWVTDKKTAIDSHGRTVTILPEIQTQTGPLKQYFYETRCRRAEQLRDVRGSRTGPQAASGGAGIAMGVAGAGCLGVDRKQWVSECKAKQSFVRALTKDSNNRMGWRWIRIDSSCVCVLLSRANRQWGERV